MKKIFERHWGSGKNVEVLQNCSHGKLRPRLDFWPITQIWLML